MPAFTNTSESPWEKRPSVCVTCIMRRRQPLKAVSNIFLMEIDYPCSSSRKPGNKAEAFRRRIDSVFPSKSYSSYQRSRTNLDGSLRYVGFPTRADPHDTLWRPQRRRRWRWNRNHSVKLPYENAAERHAPTVAGDTPRLPHSLWKSQTATLQAVEWRREYASRASRRL